MRYLLDKIPHTNKILLDLEQLAEHPVNSYDKVPFYDDHRAPFDRLILATAPAGQMPVISSDEKFQRYQDVVTAVW